MKHARTIVLGILLAAVLIGTAWKVTSGQRLMAGHSHEAGEASEVMRSGGTLSNTGMAWPSADQLRRTLRLSDYNTRVVFAGVTLLGAVGGLVGTFLLLRKRSLLCDTVSHCTLPGIALAFLLVEAAGRSGRSMPLLLAGALVTGVCGMVAVSAIRATSRIKDDAALAIVLSVFFGLGIALLVVVQQLPSGNAAGLNHYIYGKAAAMTGADARVILVASLVIALVCAALFKELKLLCFDADYASTQGWPTTTLDLTLMGLVVAVTVIGLQAVGLLLVVALLIIPPAAARFWTQRLGATVLLASLIGGISGFVGVTLSALFSKLPAGAVIVLSAVACFCISFLVGSERGILVLWLERLRMKSRVARLHLLRAIYEWCEAEGGMSGADSGSMLDRVIPLESLQRANHWSTARLRGLVHLGAVQGLILLDLKGGTCQLTAKGKLKARRVTRNHRLWEIYLLQYADVAPQHIHHNADQIEHVIDPIIVNELEELLAGRGAVVPADPELQSELPQVAS